ncbi:MAG: phosphoribosylanthranilate isomerase [Abitibacteriaceae bacterium]|nr:phosphoribosylanthranilate isomerase [Abditibacteriaceae bacterium]
MTKPVLIKICGNTSVEDALMAERAGANYLGVIVEHAPSPRQVDLAQAQRIRAAVSLPVVAVTVNLPLERLLHIHEVMQPAAFQLHGDESPELVRQLKTHGITVWGVASGDTAFVRQRALDLSEAGADVIQVDARHESANGTIYGGTGQISDWQLARELVERGLRINLAGGLTPENVAEAINTVQPWMVDVVSGVEARKGVKDGEKVRKFIENAALIPSSSA